MQASDRRAGATPRIRIPKVDVGELRRNLGLTQEQFASRYGFTLCSVRHWEEGHKEPYRVAAVLLAVIAARSDVVDQVVCPNRHPAAMPDVAWAKSTSSGKKRRGA